MRKSTLLLAAASLILTPDLFAQRPDHGGRRSGRARAERAPDMARARRSHVLRLRGVVDGEMLELLAVDLRFRRPDGSAEGDVAGPRGEGLVRIGEDRFHARVVEVGFEDGGGDEPVPEPQPAEEGDGEVASDEDGTAGGDVPQWRRRRQRLRMVVAELYAMDSTPEPIPMPAEEGDMEPEDGDAPPEGDLTIEPVPPSDALGKIYLERSSRPLGDREIPVFQGEVDVEGANGAVLARAPMSRRLARRMRRHHRRHHGSHGGGEDSDGDTDHNMDDDMDDDGADGDETDVDVTEEDVSETVEGGF